MDYTVHGVLQARILKWVAIPYSRGSSQPRDGTQVSHIAGRFFYQLSHKGSPSSCDKDQKTHKPKVVTMWSSKKKFADPQEKGMATHFSILAWRIPWTIQMGSQRVGHD